MSSYCYITSILSFGKDLVKKEKVFDYNSFFCLVYLEIDSMHTYIWSQLSKTPPLLKRYKKRPTSRYIVLNSFFAIDLLPFLTIF